MDAAIFYLLAADAILLLHVLLVAFIVLGLILVFTGRVCAWGWVRNPWFRSTHLAAISVVVVQSWFGIICPLTNWEMMLRSRAGDAVYAGSFIAHWLDSLLYYQAPAWVFAVCYTVFGAAVAAGWYWVRPRPFRRVTAHKDG